MYLSQEIFNDFQWNKLLLSGHMNRVLFLDNKLCFRKVQNMSLRRYPMISDMDSGAMSLAATAIPYFCTDWEMGQAYRSWRRQYGDNWEQKFRQKFETDMMSRYDTHFYVGTVHRYPRNWIIVGLFYPPL